VPIETIEEGTKIEKGCVEEEIVGFGFIMPVCICLCRLVSICSPSEG
jgi:hypothetical protein